MKRFKLIALDMDGTLLNEKKEISAENLLAIQQALDAGIKVVIATGRGLQSALPVLQKYQLHLPVIAVNGSEVWESPDRLLKRKLLSSEAVQFLLQIAIKHDIWWWAYAVECAFHKDHKVDDVNAIQWLKFGFESQNIDLLTKIKNQLREMDEYEITNSYEDNIEVNPKGISKASGILALCNTYGYQMSEVIAVGDSENDISLIRAAGLGVAMSNAQEEVKKAADFITLSNDEHGVAHVIHRFMLDQ